MVVSYHNGKESVLLILLEKIGYYPAIKISGKDLNSNMDTMVFIRSEEYSNEFSKSSKQSLSTTEVNLSVSLN